MGGGGAGSGGGIRFRSVNQVLTEAEMTGPGNTTRDMALPAEGRLEGVSIPELLWSLGVRQVTGALILEREALRKVIYLREGRVVFAASTDPEDRLGPFLLRRGEVGLSALLEAGSNVLRGRRLGQVLVEQEVLDSHGVMRAVIDQVREIALSVFSWREGRWRLTRASLAGDESITLDLSMEDLVLAGIRRVRDWRWIHRAVGGPRAVFRATHPDHGHNEGLGLTERAILDQVRTACRVETLCREVYAPSYDIYRALWALMIAGHVTRLDEAAGYESLGGPGEGFIVPGTVSECLLDLGDRSFSGVLRLFDGQHEGAIYLHRGQIEFATTNDPEQGLVAYLLRRGIISDRDREEAVRKLISGKRIGRLLAEGGALGEEELERFVREQLLEVCCSLVRWKTGEYQIEDGLPSEEEISLSRSPEDVIAISIGMNTAFAPMWEEIGGLASLYRLTPQYLDRLDRMTLRPQLWEVVSQLKEERTVGEICESRPESDFEVCRMLHALLAVRVIERVSEEEIVRRARERQEEVPSATQEPASASGLAWDRDPAEQGEQAPPPYLEADETPSSGPVVAESAAEMAPELFPASSSGGEAIIPEWNPVIPGSADAAIGNVGDEDPAPERPGAEHGEAEEAEDGEPLGEKILDAPESPKSSTSTVGVEQPPQAEVADSSESSAPPAAESTDEPAVIDASPAEDSSLEESAVESSPYREAIWQADPARTLKIDRSTMLPSSSESEEESLPIEAEGETSDGSVEVPVRVVPASSLEPATPPVDLDATLEDIAAVADLPVSRSGDLPVARDTDLPVAQNAELPVVPDSELPTAPDAELPVVPDSEFPTAPDVDLPVAQDAELPVTVGSEEAFDQELAPTVPDLPESPASPELDGTPAESAMDASASEGAAPETNAPEDGREAQPADPEVSAEPEPPAVEVSDAIQAEVERFNARHAVVFRQLRIEIGAGVRNFVITCGRRLGDRGEIFEGLAPDRDGRFDSQRLGEAIALQWQGNPREPLDSLIETEINLVRGLLPYDRLAAIEQSLRALEEE